MSGLLALLDDVASISKVAAASIDDVTGQAVKAGAKAAGAVIDDAAVTPKYVHGFDAKREIPIVWRIAKGSISVHPGGHAHGPQPGATEKSIGVDYFDETAVMVDTFRPLDLGEGGVAVDDGIYARSWTGGRWVGDA